MQDSTLDLDKKLEARARTTTWSERCDARNYLRVSKDLSAYELGCFMAQSNACAETLRHVALVVPYVLHDGNPELPDFTRGYLDFIGSLEGFRSDREYRAVVKFLKRFPGAPYRIIHTHKARGSW